MVRKKKEKKPTYRDADYEPALNDKFRKAEVDKILETVKSQCGNHSFRSMAEILNISTASMRNRIRKGGIALSKQEGECYFCESKNIGGLPVLYFSLVGCWIT